MTDSDTHIEHKPVTRITVIVGSVIVHTFRVCHYLCEHFKQNSKIPQFAKTAE
jgi:hypothetical protein